MNRMILALLCALLVALPARADVNYGVAPSNGRPAAGPLGYNWNGTSWVPNAGDADGNTFTRNQPIFDVVPHRISVTLASAGSDSSSVPFPLTGYRQIYAQIRLKAASFAATGCIVLAFKGSNSALTDSTALGYWYPLGVQSRRGKTLRTLDLTDRWQMIPLSDSLTNVPMQDLYGSVYVTNLTGAQIIYDLSFLGVK